MKRWIVGLVVVLVLVGVGRAIGSVETEAYGISGNTVVGYYSLDGEAYGFRPGSVLAVFG